MGSLFSKAQHIFQCILDEFLYLQEKPQVFFLKKMHQRGGGQTPPHPLGGVQALTLLSIPGAVLTPHPYPRGWFWPLVLGTFHPKWFQTIISTAQKGFRSVLAFSIIQPMNPILTTPQ